MQWERVTVSLYVANKTFQTLLIYVPLTFHSLADVWPDVTHFHYFSHVPQIETLSRIVIDKQTSVLKCVFSNLAFIKWLCGESSEAVIRGGTGCLIMTIKRERGRRLRARPPTKNNAYQVQCCQVYDNYRNCTIILPCVRCTINNPKKGQIFDHLTILWMCGCNRL